MGGVGGAIGDQVSPVEGAMWKERFDRRIKDRERRQRAREMDIGRRRGFDPTRDGISEEELDQQAQADDEEASPFANFNPVELKLTTASSADLPPVDGDATA